MSEEPMHRKRDDQRRKESQKKKKTKKKKNWSSEEEESHGSDRSDQREESGEDWDQDRNRKKRKKERRQNSFVEQIRKEAANKLSGTTDEKKVKKREKERAEKAKSEEKKREKWVKVPERAKTAEGAKVCDQCQRRKGYQMPTWCVQCGGTKRTEAVENFGLLSIAEHAKSKFAKARLPSRWDEPMQSNATFPPI